ncbi:MAG: APC family permease [Gammaproteobacteria bacterium]|nr:APC family permease [Gammaproteobacteria bacterium]
MSSVQPSLDRRIGLGLLTLFGLGNILGAGIYVLVGEVIGAAGWGAPLAFALAAASAAFSAVSYGELAARFPVSAGEAVYVEQAFRLRWLAMIVGLLIASAGMVSAATLARGFVGYFQLFAPWPGWLLVPGLVAALGALAVWGIGASMRVAGLLTLIEAAGLVLVVVVAADSFAELPARWPALLELGPGAGAGILLGAFLAFFAYIGFEDMVNVAEEVERPERNLPLAIIIALVVATVLYVLVVLVALLSVPVTELAASDAPLALVYSRATGDVPAVIGIVGMLAVINGALVQMIMASRVLYGMGRNGWLPQTLAKVDARTRTPVTATLVATGAVILLALWVPLVGLASATSFLVLCVFTLINVALWRLKRVEPRVPGVSPCADWIPVVGAITSAGLLGARLVL